MTTDLINHPEHYEGQAIKLEPIDFCERLPFCEGNAIKYCFRAGHKAGSSELQDLKKAQWYLNRRKSPGAATVSERFFELLVWLRRAEGVIGESAMATTRGDYAAFWVKLAAHVNNRIKELEDEK